MREYKYNDGVIRTGKRGQYKLEEERFLGFDVKDGAHIPQYCKLWTEELQPAPFQRNKSFNQRAWVVRRSDTVKVQLWSYNTLVMQFDPTTGMFEYLDGYAPFGSYRSKYIERRDHEARYNTVTTRLHELAFLHYITRTEMTFYNGMPYENGELDMYESFNRYDQPKHTYCQHDMVSGDYIVKVMA